MLLLKAAVVALATATQPLPATVQDCSLCGDGEPTTNAMVLSEDADALAAEAPRVDATDRQAVASTETTTLIVLHR